MLTDKENETVELSLHAASKHYVVLVADDSEAVLGVLGMALRQQGFTVLSAGSGQEAVVLYRSHCSTIHLVVLDVRMPGVDGPQTLSALREINPDICCCFMSGDTGKYTDQELLALGATAVFHKPFRLLSVAMELWELASHAA